MKAVGLAALLALAGCGTVHDLAEGPRVYGGVRHDLRMAGSGCRLQAWYLDVPGSAVLDSALLPLTLLVELVRALTGWPPAGRSER